MSADPYRTPSPVPPSGVRHRDPKPANMTVRDMLAAQGEVIAQLRAEALEARRRAEQGRRFMMLLVGALMFAAFAASHLR